MATEKDNKPFLCPGEWLLGGILCGLVCILGGEIDCRFLMGLGMAGFAIGLFMFIYKAGTSS